MVNIWNINTHFLENQTCEFWIEIGSCIAMSSINGRTDKCISRSKYGFSYGKAIPH